MSDAYTMSLFEEDTNKWYDTPTTLIREAIVYEIDTRD